MLRYARTTSLVLISILTFSCSGGGFLKHRLLGASSQAATRILGDFDPAKITGDLYFYEAPGMQASGGFKQSNSLKWPNGVLPVKFDPAFSATDRETFFSACKEWEKRAPVKCVEQTNETQYLDVIQSSAMACFSSVGRSPYGGNGVMNLGYVCVYPDVIIHELGHAFGLLHEHQRSDRDQYIDVHWENIAESAKGAYQIDQNSLNLTPYDFNSIMHYSAGSGLKRFDGTRTFDLRSAYKSAADINTIGYGALPTENDGKAMSALYASAYNPWPCGDRSRELVRGTYQSILFRDPSASEVDQSCTPIEMFTQSGVLTLANQLMQTQDFAQLSSDVVKRYGFVKSFYFYFLGREMTDEEYTKYAWDRSISLFSVLSTIVNSDEFKQRLSSGSWTSGSGGTSAPSAPSTSSGSSGSGASNLLRENQSVSSSSGRYQLVYQNDGNLVLYSLGTPIWATMTFSAPGFAIMQDDGNFVVYDATNRPIWASWTQGNPGSKLVLKDDGALLILAADGRELWRAR